ncbi:MAG: molybdopterin biosynthesis protein [Methanomicrobiales archaeon]|jgi:putative molybdopterin biosynthesis protein|nr:molybdopterin biosynthesis protein [Methanomicrobiales archaeon]
MVGERTRYLSLAPLSDIHALWKEAFSCTPRTELIPLDRACGRITAQALYSRLSAPARHLSAMDGIAVLSSDTEGATEQKPVHLTNAILVNTGNLIPDGYNAVIMIEYVEEVPNGWIIREEVPPWQHVRPVGEDIAESEMVVPSHHIIRPQDIGALAAYGITEVPVLALQVTVIPTGDELVPFGTGLLPAPGQVIESNMLMAQAYLEQKHIEVHRTSIVPDDPDAIRNTVLSAVHDSDMVFLSAGTSKGTKDYSARLLEELGSVLVHGISMKPGKPVIIGVIDQKPVICLPGYPVAAYTALREVVDSLLFAYGLLDAPVESEEGIVQAKLTTTLPSDIGTTEFVLATVGNIHGDWIVQPQSRGSGVMMSMVRANAYIQIPPSTEGISSGSVVPARLSVSHAQARASILITGSHDPCLDILADIAAKQGIVIYSSHVGSMGGLLALRKDECHAAPMHLLDEQGEYNISYLNKYCPDVRLMLVCVAKREQGVISRNGLHLSDIQSHTFLNRQKGSGTRILLDHLLRGEGIDPASIDGYEREVTTHLAVCLGIQSGFAEMGVGVYSAAKACNLSFVPIGYERYELVIREELYRDDSRMAQIVSLIQSPEFSAKLTELGGYNVSETGSVRYVGGS